MSTKERPTLGGTRIKTRKRNIAIPLDPSSFADAVVQIYLEHAGDLELIAKDIEASDLDFSRYGDTFFEIVFTGSRNQPGTAKPEDVHCVLNCGPCLLTEVIWCATRDNFLALLNDSLVAKGTVLGFVSETFKHFLLEGSLDDLIALLKRAKMEDRLLDFFPMQKRTPEAFAEHFSKEGLGVLVEYNDKKVFDVKLKELRTSLADQISANSDMNGDSQNPSQGISSASC